MNNNSRYWMAQAFGWTSYLVFLFVSTFVLGKIQWDKNTFIQLLINALAGLISTHLLHKTYQKIQFGRLIPRRQILLILFMSVIMAFVMTLFTESIEVIVFAELIIISWKAFVFQLLGNSLLILIWNLIYFLYHFITLTYQERLRRISLEVTRREAELNQLKSQLNPHFLFNSLNGIRALVALNPKEAKQAITQLSELLRSTLSFGKHDKISLSEEVKMVENYLHLEQMRLDDRLRVDWSLDINSSTLQIPPFTLQLLVENAIKHGVSKLASGGNVKISIKEMKDFIRLEVINPGIYEPLEAQGIGIQNLNSRLTHFYGENTQLEIANRNNTVIASITIPTNEL